jgi:hypothetical protein
MSLNSFQSPPATHEVQAGVRVEPVPCQLAFSFDAALGCTKEGTMLALPIILLASVQSLPAGAVPVSAPGEAAASQGPPEPTAKPGRKLDNNAAKPSCRNILPTEPGEIIVCAERPQGYRIDPDLLEAQRIVRDLKTRPKPPDRMADTSCQTVGPMGCRGQAGINLLAAALTAAEMAKRLSEGKEIGSMFITDPQPDEYQIYLALKKAREEKAQETAE